MNFEGLTKQPVSLVDLCVRKAIDNVRYIGYVGGVDFQLLERILQHCTLEQLKHIEDSTDDTDLSPVTNEFWKRFYKKSFGEKNMNFVVEEMDRLEVYYKWRELYEAKLIELEKKEIKVADKLKNSYKDNDARKVSRQTKLCAKAPPSKKPFWGNGVSGYNVSNVKSNIMRKAKLDLLKSHEVKNLTAIKRKTIHKSISAPQRIDFSGNAPSTSRSNAYSERNLPMKRTNSLLGTGPGTSNGISSGKGNLPAHRINSLLGTAPSVSRNIPSNERNPPAKRINGLLGTAPSTSRGILSGERKLPSTSRGILSGERKLPPRSTNSLLGTAPSTARSIVTGERNLPRKSVNSLLGTAPSTSRPQGILPAKRTNSLLGTAPSTSRSIARGESDLPPKRFNNLPSNATPTSRNAGTKRKHAM